MKPRFPTDFHCFIFKVIYATRCHSSWSYIIFFFQLAKLIQVKKGIATNIQWIPALAGLHVFDVFNTCLKFGILCVLIQCRYRVPALFLSLLYCVQCEVKMESRGSERLEAAKREVARPIPSSIFSNHLYHKFLSLGRLFEICWYEYQN